MFIHTAFVGAPATGNVVEGNFIGIDATGTKSLADGPGWGVMSSASDTTIGGTVAGARNVIIGSINLDNDVYTTAPPTGSVIQNNYIGTDVTGTVSILGTISLGGVRDVTIGGNVIAGGIAVDDRAKFSNGDFTIQGNLIGTDASGQEGVRRRRGVSLGYSSNDTVLGNVIAVEVGSSYVGIAAGGDDNIFQGNFIGTDASGTLDLGNVGGDGVIISGNRNTIGGPSPAEGNVIAFNGFGVYVETGKDNRITHNSIFSNTAGGIYLLPPGNNSQRAPVLSYAAGPDDTGTLSGTLNAAPVPDT